MDYTFLCIYLYRVFKYNRTGSMLHIEKISAPWPIRTANSYTFRRMYVRLRFQIHRQRPLKFHVTTKRFITGCGVTRLVTILCCSWYWHLNSFWSMLNCYIKAKITKNGWQGTFRSPNWKPTRGKFGDVSWNSWESAVHCIHYHTGGVASKKSTCLIYCNYLYMCNLYLCELAKHFVGFIESVLML